MIKKKNILFIITEDWYYLSHRRDLALYGSKQGYKINILTKINDTKIHKLDKKITLIDWGLDRSSINFFKEFQSINKIHKTIKAIKPDIIHAVGIKPIIYSGLTSKFNKNVSFIYTFAGLGSIFTNTNFKKYFLQKLISLLMKLFFKLNKSIIIFQNSQDLKLFNTTIDLKIENKIIKGSGINPNKFKFNNLKNPKKIQILLPSRILYDKGFEDFIYCAFEIKKKFKNSVNFVIAGKIDSANPSAVSKTILTKYIEENVIIWFDNVNNIHNVYDKTDIICFPSFREGNPRALLESACCELPIVSYDVAGCNDIVIDNHSGFLIPFRDKNKMKNALEKLIIDYNLRKFLGKNARNHVIDNFSNTIIFNQYLEIWKKIL